MQAKNRVIFAKCHSCPKSRSEIMQAIAPYLPINYNKVSMEHKLSNILNRMRKEEIISVQGERRHAKWKLF